MKKRAPRRASMSCSGIDPPSKRTDLLHMNREITIQARWDGEASVWLATSEDVPGLVVEADTWPAMINEVQLVLPQLLEVSGQGADKLSLTFKAEEQRDL